MKRSVVGYDSRLPRELVQVFRAGDLFDAIRIYLNSQLLVIDCIEWECDMAEIQKALVPERREFKAAYSKGPPHEAAKQEIERLKKHMRHVYNSLFAIDEKFAPSDERWSFRPMITGPEPMHFDSYGGEAPIVTSYLNISAEPRKYRIARSMPLLWLEQSEEMAEFRRKTVDEEICYALRIASMRGTGPLGPDAPRHDVALAPGSIWFFNAKMVSHEVVYGSGALGASWGVPNCGALMPRDIVRCLT